MNRLAVLSLKGGVGKTTITLGLAEQARRCGLNTLVIDLDPQANATETLREKTCQLTINDALVDGRPGIAAEAVANSDWGSGLSLIGAEPALEHRNRDSDPTSAARLRTVTKGLGDEYDLVLMDCPPAMGGLTRGGLVAADGALIVTEPSFHALRGASQALAAVQTARDISNAGLGVAGIVVNRYRSVVREHQVRVAELREAYPNLVRDPLLPERSAIATATGAGVPVQSLPGPAARAITQRYEELLVDLGVLHRATEGAPA